MELTEKRNCLIQIKLAPSERARIQHAAASQQLPFTVWARQVLLLKVEQLLKERSA